MEDQIAHFIEQFSWEPQIENADKLPAVPSRTIVCGMGGSHLGAHLLLRHDPTMPLFIHSDYGLPRLPKNDLADALIIASSYSGETEETIDAAHAAVAAGLSVAVVTTGGTLADYAREQTLPLIILPKLPFEPRMAVGVQMLAIARLMHDETLEEMVRTVGSTLDTNRNRTEATALAESLGEATPVIYASTLNFSIAYFWKIALNETGKIPSFYNLFPELCHNELSGYDATDTAQDRITRLHALMLTDESDHPRIAKRMRIMQNLLIAKGVEVDTVTLPGKSGLEKALYGVLAGVWFALAMAKRYGAPDAATPLIADFKHKMTEPDL